MTETNTNQLNRQKKIPYCRPELKKMGNVSKLTLTSPAFDGVSFDVSFGADYTDFS